MTGVQTCALPILFEIEHLLTKYPETLSGGERQRVAIAFTLLLEPKLLLHDEPTVHLDVKNRNLVQKILKNKQGEWNIPIIYVTHSYSESLNMANRIGIFSEGSFLQIGLYDEIIENPLNEEVASFFEKKLSKIYL